MIQFTFARRMFVFAGFILLVNLSALRAQETKASLCFENLVRMNWCELEQIYRQAKPGSVPVGFARGQVVYSPCELLAASKGRLASLVWHGKIFGCDGTLINQWTGLRAIRAKVELGPSWLDGEQAIILDYCGMSRVWHDVRDEMREVAPGLYVGAMYRRRCPCPELKVFFVLQACDRCSN
jgi:hypothetical protein